jgi:predicted  nucleic acid-binding Zn-ribbon protein
MDRETVDEIKRHFGVVAEGLESQIQAVAEGQDLLREQLQGVDRRVEGLDTRVEGVDRRVGGLEKRFDGLETRMDREFNEVKAMIRLSYVEIDRSQRAARRRPLAAGSSSRRNCPV